MAKNEGDPLQGAEPDEQMWSKASNLGRLEQRVFNVEDTLKEIKEDFRNFRGQITDIHKAIVAIGKPQYSVISGFGGVILVCAAGVWGLAIGPVKDDIARLYSFGDKLSLKIDDSTKLMDVKKLDRESFDAAKADLNAAIRELNARLKRQ